VSETVPSVAEDGREAPAGRAAGRLLRSPNAVRFAVLIVLIAAFAIASKGATIGAANIANVLAQSAIRGIAACGQAFVVLTAGLDLSVSGVVALALMIGGSLVTTNPAYSLLGFALPPALALIAMLVVGTGFGAVNGVIVARFRLPALIVTLGTWQIGIGLAYQVTGSGFVDQLPENVAYLGQGEILFVPIPILILFAVVAVSHYLLHRTPFGAEVYAVGGNPRAATISGVRVVRVRIAVFAIAGFLYGVGSVLAMSRYLSATMAQATGLELATIAAVAIGGVSLSGGRGTIIGVLLGTLIIGVLENGLNVMGVGPAWQAIVKGLIIVAAVALDAMRRQ
jgi:ribose/xylose/arabinose/galactoside ABC-type transport system permease subunit